MGTLDVEDRPATGSKSQTDLNGTENSCPSADHHLQKEVWFIKIDAVVVPPWFIKIDAVVVNMNQWLKGGLGCILKTQFDSSLG